MKIIVAIDESDQCKMLMHDVAQRGWAEETDIMLLNVIETSPFEIDAYLNGESLRRLKQKLEERSLTLLDDAAAYLRENLNKSSRIHKASSEGRPASEIVKVATDWGADLVILSSHDRRGVPRMILGSVAESVMQHAPCSVELVRHKSAVRKSSKKDETALLC